MARRIAVVLMMMVLASCSIGGGAGSSQAGNPDDTAKSDGSNTTVAVEGASGEGQGRTETAVTDDSASPSDSADESGTAKDGTEPPDSGLNCEETTGILGEDADLYNEIDGEVFLNLKSGDGVVECGSQDGWYAYAYEAPGLTTDCSTPVHSKVCPLGWSKSKLVVSYAG